MPLDQLVGSLEKGIGNILGFLVMILGFGAMLGKLVAESGAAQRITEGLVAYFGVKNTKIAVMLTGFLVGITLFYSVGFVILVPLVFTVAASTGLPLIQVALPMLASLSVTHGFLPPHPAPSALSVMFEADLGKTLLYGFIVSIPAILISGPVLVRFLPKVQARPIKEFQASRVFTKEEMPGLGISLFTTLLPVLIIGIATVLIELNSLSAQTTTVVEFIGNPVIALLITVLFAAYVLGIRRGKSVKEVMDIYANSIKGITMVLLIIAGSGALKQILVDSGVSQEIGVMLEGINISPLIIAWFIATVIRFTVGSATVAGLTAQQVLCFRWSALLM